MAVVEAGQRAGDISPPVLNQVDRDVLRLEQAVLEVVHPLDLPAGLKSFGPILVRLRVAAVVDHRGCPLEDEQLPGPFRQMRDRLDRRTARPDDGDALVGELGQPRFLGRPAGIVVLPPRVQEHLARERAEPVDRRQLGLGETSRAQGDEPCTEDIALIGPDDPALGGLVPDKALRLGIEQRARRDIERLGEMLEIPLKLWLPCIFPLGHVPSLVEEGHVDVGVGVAGRARILVPEPGAAEIRAALEQAQIGDALLDQATRGHDPGHPAADDDDVEVFLQWRAGRLGLRPERRQQLRGLILGKRVVAASGGAEASVALRDVSLPEPRQVDLGCSRHSRILRKFTATEDGEAGGCTARPRQGPASAAP